MRWLAALLLLLSILVIPTTSGRAETPSIGVFFDEAGTIRWSYPQPGEPGQEFWVLAFGTQELEGFELSLDIDPRVNAYGGEIVAGTDPVDHGVGDDNWIVDLEGCVTATDPLPLLHYRFLYLDRNAKDLYICIQPSDPSSLDPPMFGYRQCDGTVVAAAPKASTPGARPGCAVVQFQIGILPNGGEVWVAGTTQTISWTILEPSIETYLLQYTIDDGSTWQTLGPAVDSEYEWLVPDTPTELGRVRVVETYTYEGYVMYGLVIQSARTFSIVPAVPTATRSWGAVKARYR